MKLCRQCGYEIKPSSRLRDKLAQRQGYCCGGCEEVYYKLKEWDVKEIAK